MIQFTFKNAFLGTEKAAQRGLLSPVVFKLFCTVNQYSNPLFSSAVLSSQNQLPKALLHLCS